MKNLLRVGLAAILFAAGLDAAESVSNPTGKTPSLPKFVELGASGCVPCKRMKPIVEELTKEQTGVIDVEFIDVKKNRAAAAAHKVRLIPCQVFLDGSGKELFRHEGFWSKQDITAKWKELGVTLKPAPSVKPDVSAATDAPPAGSCCAPATPRTPGKTAAPQPPVAPLASPPGDAAK